MPFHVCKELFLPYSDSLPHMKDSIMLNEVAICQEVNCYVLLPIYHLQLHFSNEYLLFKAFSLCCFVWE